MATRKRKSWRDKLRDAKGLPKIVTIDRKLVEHWGTDRMVIPAPAEVDAVMKKVPRGRVTTIHEVRAAIARRHGRNVIACPLTTGIFAWIAANAAAEAAAEGQTKVTPWWRTLKAGGKLNPKYPGGVEEQARRLEAEGHAIRRGKGGVPAAVERIETVLFEP